MPKWQSGKVAIFLPHSHFGTFDPVHQFEKFSWPNDFPLIIMKDL